MLVLVGCFRFPLKYKFTRGRNVSSCVLAVVCTGLQKAFLRRVLLCNLMLLFANSFHCFPVKAKLAERRLTRRCQPSFVFCFFFCFMTVRVLHAQAVGGFAGPGSLTTVPAGAIQIPATDGGFVEFSGTFVRDDGVALPDSAALFVYIENSAQPDDFSRGRAFLNVSSGGFAAGVGDVPVGDSKVFLNFVVLDPLEALDPSGADTVFALDVSNAAVCEPSLTFTLELFDGVSVPQILVTEPDEEFPFLSLRGVSAVL